MTSLLSLPTELLQRIACYLPYSAALNLTRTSRRLLAACNDRLVFRHIALHTHQNIDWDREAVVVKWKDGSQYLDNASIEDVVRVAYAVERVLTITSEKQTTLSWFRQDSAPEPTPTVHPDVEEWLPQLFALHHPGCSYLRAIPLLDLYLAVAHRVGEIGSNQQDTIDFINIKFCLTYRILENLSNINIEHATSCLFLDLFEKDNALSSDVYRKAVWRLNFLKGDPQRRGEFTLVQASACVLPFIYSIARSGYLTQVPLPVPSCMAFGTYMTIPGIFRSTSEQFATCHIQKMTSSDFLSGEWVGYFTDQRGGVFEIPYVDPPMHTILIDAQTPGKDHRLEPDLSSVLSPSTRGADSYGNFSIRGKVFKDGRVDAIKRYEVQGWEWRWKGFVMPYGIAGYWGGVHGRFGGYFWIWKKEWCV